MTDIAGKIILITGGARGLGRGVAERSLQRGATVVLWDLDGEQLDATLREIGGDAHGYVVDITDRAAVYETADRVFEEVGRVDILVNNAGVVTGTSFLELPDEQIERTFAVNTLSLFWTTKAFLPEMMKAGTGHVVTIASLAGLLGVQKLADYCASKFAAVGFDESLRVAMKSEKTGVKTTVVCPYFINTGMFDGVHTRFPLLLPILEEDDVADAIVEAIEKNKPKVVLPTLAKMLPVLRVLPTALFDGVMGLLGVNRAMEHFRGREGGASDERTRESMRTAKLFH